MRDPGKERDYPLPGGVLTTDFAAVIDEHVRENMRAVLGAIRDGSFAREWIAEMDRGQPSLDEYRAKLAEKQIEVVGARLRALNVKEETAGVG